MNEDYTEEELKTCRAVILNLLETNEKCRNDDKVLTYLVMRHFTRIYIPFEDFKKIPAFATIQKVRQHIQNKEHLYPPTDPAVLEKRQHRQEVFRQAMAR